MFLWFNDYTIVCISLLVLVMQVHNFASVIAILIDI